jgi:WD40 repeat protein
MIFIHFSPCVIWLRVSYTHDDTNNKVTFTNQRGFDRIYWYDWLSRLTKVEEEYTINLFAQTTYQYDESGNLIYSPDGKYLASGSWDDTVKIWDVDTFREAGTLIGHANYVTGVAYSPDGKYLASCSYDKIVKIWDMDTLKEIATLEGHADHVFCVAHSPDRKYLASGSYDKTVKIWDFSKSEVQKINSIRENPEF